MIRRRHLLGLLAALVLLSPFSAPAQQEIARARGVYTFECRDAWGNLKWSDRIDNTVVTVGKNLLLDTGFAGAAYTVTGPYIGLIASTSFVSISASDTMASHAGWLEAGGGTAPTYTGNRPLTAWSAASGGSKALSAAATYAITSNASLQGAFIVYGTGALATKDNTAGTLYSAGQFSGGARAVVNGDTVNVSYSTSL